VSYIAGGYQTQLGAETHIVAAICEFSPRRISARTLSVELMESVESK